MGECPLCGQPTYKASTRLIKDACGHTKCRLCLLQEESGCSICKGEKVEKFLYRNSSIDNFETPSYENYKPLELVVNKIPELPTNSHISCLSIDRKYIINKDDSQNVQKKQFEEIENECDKIEGNNSIHNKTTDKQLVNKEDQKYHSFSFKTTEINQLNSTAIEPHVENISNEFNSTNCPTENISSTNGNKNVMKRIEEYQKEKEDYTQSNSTPLKLVVEKNPDKFQYGDCLSVEKKFPETENIILEERIEENEKEKLDCDNLNKTSNQFLSNKSPDFKLSDYLFFKNRNEKIARNELIGSPVLSLGYKSPDFKLSDYLSFKNRNEKIAQNELIGSPTQSVGYKSPDFRLSDYILLKKKSTTLESTTEIEEDNENEKTSQNELDIAPLPVIINKNSDNCYHIESCSITKRVVEATTEKDTTEKEEEHQNERVNYDHLKCYEFPSYSMFEKKLRDNENVTDKAENSQNKEKDNDQLNSTPIESIKRGSNNFESAHSSTEKLVKIHECDKIEVKQSEKIEDDEDKENKEKCNERKEREVNTKETNSGESVSLASVNHETHKAKDKIQEDQNKTEEKNRKSLSKQSKHKKIQEKSKKNDIQITVRKGKRKRKPKVLFYEDDFEETKRVSPKRRKQNRDWSHIVTLPGSTVTYRCTLCEKVFKSPQGKWYHASCLSGKAPFRCHMCSRTFAKRSHFEYHERMHTGNKPFRCNVCDKSFVQKSKLNRHLLIHKQKNDIECAECGRKFSTKQYLKNHMTIHQNNSFKCKFCPKTFTLAFNRKRHERSHSTDRPYKCDICSKDFKGKFLLTRHRRTHDKNRPFSCHDCHRVFLSKFEVQRHMSVHSDIKPYACTQCNLEFRRKDNLNRHVKHHHTIDYDPPKPIETNKKNTDEQIDITAKNVNIKENNEPAAEKKQSNEKKNSMSNNIMDKPGNTLKPKPKPKRISRSNSTSSAKSLLKTSLGSPQPHRQIISKPDLSNAVPVIRGPISIKRFTENSEMPSARLGLTQPIPLEEAVVLNRQIEEKIYTQDSFCNYPGLNRRANSIVRRRDSCGSNSNSNDGIGFTCKQNQERSKTVHFSKDDPYDAQKSDEPKVVKDINLHWRRRTAESLRTKVAKNKQI